MASSSRPLDKNITEPSGRLKLEWDAYFSRIESQIADLAAQITSGGVPSTREVIAGAGLTGGGDLSTDRTFDVGQGTGITVGADSVSTNDAEIVHDNLSGFVANEHIDHSGVTLTAGAGLTGGGDITTSRSFAVGAGTGITVNADDVAITAGGVGTTQLADEGVTMAKLEHAGAYTLLMRNAGTTGDPAYTKISALTDAGAFGSGDKLMIEEASGELRKIDYDDLPGGGGGSSDLVLLDSGTVSAAATLDISLTSFTSYRSLVFKLYNFLPATDNTTLQLLLSTNGGSSFVGSGYQYAALEGQSDTAVIDHLQSASATQINICAEVANNANYGVSLSLELALPSGTTRPRLWWDGVQWDVDDDIRRIWGAAGNTTAQDIDAVRFRFSSGNIASGTYAVYGYA